MRLIEINQIVFNPDAIDIIQSTGTHACVAKFRGGEEGNFPLSATDLAEKIRKALGAY